MNEDRNKILTLAAFLGAIGMNVGIGAASIFEVAVAPPVVTLPIMVVNSAWAMMFFFLVRHDIRPGYLGAIVVGASTILLPVLVFFSVFDPGPEVRPTHFVGVLSDIAFGSTLIVTGLRGWRGFIEEAPAQTT